MKTIPKYIKNHPGIELYDTGENQGSDYRWYAEFKDGWCMSSGRNEGGGSLFFNSKDDLKPLVPVEVYRKLLRLYGRAPQQRGA